jgi:hypothetical protein
MALFALFAYVGESAAALCPPEMETHAAADAHAHDLPAGSPDAPRTDAPPCPLGMSGAGSTCVAAPLPSAATTAGAPALDGTPALAFPDDTRDRLLVAAHFRPPRA